MEKYKKTAYIGINILIYLFLAYLLLKYALPILFPFILSLSVVLICRPLVNKISKHTKVPKGIISLFVIGIALTLTVYLTIIALSALLEQIGAMISVAINHLNSENNYISVALAFIDSLVNKFPFIKNNLPESTSVYTIALDMARDALSSLSSSLTVAVGRVVAMTPEIIITVIVVVLSLFYFSKDYNKIAGAISAHLPSGIKERLPKIKNTVLFVLTSYLRSYAILLLLTFSQVFFGLLILGAKNAFAMALICALVDMLPVLGVGTVLVPWSVISFVAGDTRLAVGLLVLFVIVYIVRQVIEPKIVSAHLNIHPLIAIISVYAGLKIAGIGGMIVAPLVTFVIKTLIDGLKNDKEKQKDIEKE